jgi:hypothetical protein
MCGVHNRLKEQGWRVTRDGAGGWHVYRPDGSELVAPDPPHGPDPPA